MDFTTVKKNLTDLGYLVSCFDTAKEAADYLKNAIQNCTVGFGGSVTLQDMGLYEALSENTTVFWHWQLKEGETADDA